MLEKNPGQRFNAYNSPHEDLREFIKRAEEAGEILRITGVDTHLEMGTLAEIVNHARPEPPAIRFEDVPGYPKDIRLLSGATNSSKRLALTLGLPVPRAIIDACRPYERLKDFPRVARASPELTQQVAAKFHDVLARIGCA